MKTLLVISALLLPGISFAGTATFSFGTGGGTITISSGTAVGAGAQTFTNIQHKSCSAYTNTDACAFDAGITAHSLIVVGCLTDATVNTINVSDNNGNVYSTATVALAGSGTHRAGIYYTLNANAGATTITCHETSNTAGYLAQSVHEYGSTGAGTFDIASSSSPVTATANPTATPMNTSLANEFVFAFTQDDASVTAQSGTLRENYVDNYWQASEDTVVVPAGSYISTFTSTAGGSPWIMLQAAFK